MTERLPYEDELSNGLNELPLPDENLAWADMKRRLDEDEDDKIPPIWLRGCAIWGLLGILLLGFAWWIIRPEKWFHSHSHQTTNQPLVKPADEKKDTNRSDSFTSINVNIPSSVDRVKSDSAVKLPAVGSPRLRTRSAVVLKDSAVGGTRLRTPSAVVLKDSAVGGQRSAVVSMPPAIHQRPVKQAAKKNKKEQKLKEEPATVNNKEQKTGEKPQQHDSTKTSDNAVDSLRQKVETYVDTGTPLHSTLKKAKPAADNKTSAITRATSAKDSSKTRRRFSFAAGLGMQQQLPIGGQKLTPYNASGRKGSLADYIPSVYLRLYRENKWFLQSEFKYGAPNYTKGFLYDQVIVADSSQTIVTTTSTSLKKTFYHQLPVTFNYFVLPKFSLGAGFIWNKFSGAVSSRDIIEHDNQTSLDLTLLKDAVIIVKPGDTSFSRQDFAKSYLQAVVESQYKWKRFSFGARYAFGLQPYIRFNLPGGLHKEEKNSSLQIFIHYELWRSSRR